MGFDRRSLRIVLISLAAVGALGTILRFVAPVGPRPIGGTTLTPVVPDGQSEAGTGFAVGFFILLLVLGVIAALVLARLWLRRQPAAAPDADETRVIDHGGEGEAPHAAGHARPGSGAVRARPMPWPPTAPCSTTWTGARRWPASPGRPRPSTPIACAPRVTAAWASISSRPTTGWSASGARRSPRPRPAVRSCARTTCDGRCSACRSRLRKLSGSAPACAGRQAAAPGPEGVRGSRRGAGPGADLPDADQPGALNTILTRIRRGP